MTENMSVEELRAALKSAEAVEVLRAKQIKDATPVVWKYTIELDDREQRFNPVFDSTVILYRLTGQVTNEDEAKAAGHHLHSTIGSMVYAYNTVTQEIITAIGGGTIYISDGTYPKTPAGEAKYTMNQINAFLAVHPEGGDVTHIVAAHQARKDEARNAHNAKRM